MNYNQRKFSHETIYVFGKKRNVNLKCPLLRQLTTDELQLHITNCMSWSHCNDLPNSGSFLLKAEELPLQFVCGERRACWTSCGYAKFLLLYLFVPFVITTGTKTICCYRHDSKSLSACKHIWSSRSNYVLIPVVRTSFVCTQILEPRIYKNASYIHIHKYEFMYIYM